ncbi:sodium- and chloride-dependent transporter XTRP3 isoform X1 [Astyanax mexicanus]|uniref:sodium- and chloride-dependent transporter XTRP3-like isoform X2 n=1 Tax=Astyanax mexicanus TaxID=7994 RepID=UPI0020CAA74E|nr:sodium- and chloride-dependent transporter XTRP3-like isoform X2 [Astyanax mexicanus]XP_049329982.1 sodium- and chloride-dependent transporter XTRP3 isoform X1 [Astyanax mexicanus]XP_049329983.1 sodium- and chloride-dependent transporter XTRP3 isoform X1 [Astyanax mexicanus]XP_049329984.1 sodium- and chloride-dependent transporter XTRP3 isoform X1 [Astyanax mexicanus]XP_049329985.1 sodium- and chloride-dependent transporter XTRP3 isoform X1 [Astyanax mexicanus]XP_049329987.1 sodium- and chl
MEKESRPSWDNPMQFILACVSYAVGLGNVWRFPYLCQMHGGGGFMIPYLVMLVLEGIPLFCMELAIGQKMRLGSIGAWSAISPYLGGVGMASVVTSLYLCLYYNVINAWSFWYLFHSFQAVLPWSQCPVNTNRTAFVEECEVASPTQYFFFRQTLNISPSIQQSGGVHVGQALCLLLAWIIVYLFIVRGVKSTGKVVYFTATFPYLVLLVYLIRGVTLHGALNGVKYMFTPKLEQLANPQTWINAATQIFFSLGLGFGSLIAFSSYNHHNNDFEKQAIAVSLINSGTSIFASVVTFSIYGFKATYNYENCLERMKLLLINTFDLAEESIHKQNISFWISELNQTHPDQFGLISSRVEHCSLEQELDTAVEGTGLAFIVYSEAITNMPAAQLWSVLYFFMLLLLGMGSMLGNVMAIITPLRDFKPLARSFSNETLNGLVCAFCLLLGIGFTTPAGNYWFTMFNEYGATFSLLFIVLIEVFTVSYIYGLKRFEKDVEDMLGRRPGWYWKVMWAAVSPLLLISLFIFYIINYIQGGVPTYQAWDKEKGRLVVTEYPVFGQAFIGVLLVSSVSCIPLAALYAFCTRHQRGVPVRKGSARSRTSSV